MKVVNILVRVRCKGFYYPTMFHSRNIGIVPNQKRVRVPNINWLRHLSGILHFGNVCVEIKSRE